MLVLLSRQMFDASMIRDVTGLFDDENQRLTKG
jgi:hypothetical protein